MEFILRNFVTDFVDRTRQLVLYHDVDLILGIFGRLQREYAFSDRIAPFAAVGELELLDLFFGQVGIVHHIEEEVLRPVLQLVDIDVLLFAGPAHEDIAAAVHQNGQKVTYLHLHILDLLILGGHRRQVTGDTRIDVHRRSHQEEYEQQESDVGH